MPLNVGQWITFFSLCALFLVFLFYDAFRRGEPYGNIAYIAAIIPSTYIWHSVTLPGNYLYYEPWGTTGAWVILTGLWSIAMLRDIVLVFLKRKDIDDIALWLGIAFIFQLIISAILPIDVILPHMQNSSVLSLNFLWMPDVFSSSTSIIARMLLRIFSTWIVVGLILPMIRDFKGQPVNMFALLVITLLISAPFALISYLWLPEYWYALLSAFAVIFFIFILLLTRGGTQYKKIRPPVKRPSTKPKPEQNQPDIENSSSAKEELPPSE
ncbi:MAG: hypothetical protein JW776_14000 [Candidatus Lokiarchaeota archaeon]|nr:hypothetical protein [Candidatus Lokiarchaeota archaeon]